MIGNRIREVRELHGLSQKKLANQLFVSQQAVAKWEKGITQPTPDMIGKIAVVFGVTSDYLMGISDDDGFAVTITDEDPQVLQIKEIFKGMSAQGIQKVVEYADDLAASGRYPKKPLNLNR